MATPTPEVFVPAIHNPACPIMGKPISGKLFVDTERGRIYLCCKPCADEVLVDVDLAYLTSFPTERRLENALCPLSGNPVPEDASRVSLQGLSVRLCSPDCLALAREIPQVVLARLEHPEWVHVDNRTCPVTDEPAGRNTLLVIKGALVHVSDVKVLGTVRADPDGTLARAKELATAERLERERKARERRASGCTVPGPTGR